MGKHVSKDQWDEKIPEKYLYVDFWVRLVRFQCVEFKDIIVNLTKILTSR